MNVLVIGSGGREHALVWKISKSNKVDKIYCAPGNAGTGLLAENIDIAADDIASLLSFATENKIDLTVVGPEVPLVLGITDKFNEKGLRIFGPDSHGAKLEGSKIFCKEILEKYNIPTAEYMEFSDLNKARSYVKEKGAPIVIKADGLAAGKGVTVAMTEQEALDSLDSMMSDRIFGESGSNVVIEEFMEGEEASILAFCDGKTVLPMTSSQDHKRIYDGDKGPNTGGMGAYSPAPIVTSEMDKKIYEKVLLPTLNGLINEGIEYKGILYAGLMIKDNEPKVVEYNVRLGDPETQVVLPRMKNDIVDVFNACIDGDLDEVTLEWTDDSAIGVVVAAGGYPASYKKGNEISGLISFDEIETLEVFHAGTAIKEGTVVTSGGRVLCVVSMASDLKNAYDKVYKEIDKIKFKDAFYRKDIAMKGL